LNLVLEKLGSLAILKLPYAIIYHWSIWVS
jgi:hypothetical protein